MKEQNSWPSYTNGEPKRDSDNSSQASADHFTTRDNIHCAGTHIIADFWCDQGLDDLVLIERALRDSVQAAQATLLHIHLHHFTEGGGVSGVAVLAESHISVHTWPERGFAAFDIFMCGETQPEAAIDVLIKAFKPHNTQLITHFRGRATDN